MPAVLFLYLLSVIGSLCWQLRCSWRCRHSPCCHMFTHISSHNDSVPADSSEHVRVCGRASPVCCRAGRKSRLSFVAQWFSITFYNVDPYLENKMNIVSCYRYLQTDLCRWWLSVYRSRYTGCLPYLLRNFSSFKGNNRVLNKCFLSNPNILKIKKIPFKII